MWRVRPWRGESIWGEIKTMSQEPGAEAIASPPSLNRPLRWETREHEWETRGSAAPRHAQSADPFDVLMPPKNPATSTNPHRRTEADWSNHLARTEKNWLAIAALVSALFIAAPLAILFGHRALNAASRDQAQNAGMAIAALILGYLGILVGVVWFIVVAIAVS